MTPDVGLLELAAVAVLVLLSGAIGLVLQLGITRSLLIAALRSVVQLGLLGLLLDRLFAVEHPAWVLLWLTVMVVAATRAALARPAYRVPGAAPLAFFGLALTALATTFAVTAGVLQTEPWWQPRVVVPLCGMLLGNALNGIALTLDSLLSTLRAERDAIELHLALGADRQEALRGPMRAALRRGMTPIINAMSVVGIVSLPGMMTGQILAGAEPWQAVRWQLVILFMIAGATTLGSLAVGLAVGARVMTADPTLRMDRILPRDEKVLAQTK
ncbi:MAG: iron export ABC transporter permease subunit FetB [Deltaproteobacteria bacterium]|nr:iron export ABC transporter permease subunit FetB [Deltaproteobacteria bacterium]